MCFPCSILNTDQHEQNTEFFSLKYEGPYIDLNNLEKNFGSVFFAFRAMVFILLFLEDFFRFSVFSGQLLRYGHILPNPKLNKVINGLCVLFAKKYGVSLFNTKCGFVVFNTKY